VKSRRTSEYGDKYVERIGLYVGSRIKTHEMNCGPTARLLNRIAQRTFSAQSEVSIYTAVLYWRSKGSSVSPTFLRRFFPWLSLLLANCSWVSEDNPLRGNSVFKLFEIETQIHTRTDYHVFCDGNQFMHANYCILTACISSLSHFTALRFLTCCAFVSWFHATFYLSYWI